MSYDKPIGLLFKHKPEVRSFQDDATLPLGNKYVGIEIEAENIPYSLEESSSRLMYWDIDTDGSLRNYGAEFISKMLRGGDIVAALNELEEFFKKYNITPDYTSRTSVHVHVDARYLSLAQLQSLVANYLIHEPLLFNYVGHNRDQNSYCIPFYKNSRGLHNLSTLYRDKAGSQNVLNVTRNAYKYEAMNLKSIQDKGSIEFRHHFGTNNKEQLLRWIRGILYLFKSSKAISYNELIGHYSRVPYEDFTVDLRSYLNIPPSKQAEELARRNIIGLMIPAYSDQKDLFHVVNQRVHRKTKKESF